MPGTPLLDLGRKLAGSPAGTDARPQGRTSPLLELGRRIASDPLLIQVEERTRALLADAPLMAALREQYPDAESDEAIARGVAMREVYGPSGVASRGQAAPPERTLWQALRQAPSDFAGGLARGAIAMPAQAIASTIGTVAELAGAPETAERFYEAGEEIAADAPQARGAAGFVGTAVGNIAPALLGAPGVARAAAGGAVSLRALLGYYGLQGFGAGAEDYRQTLLARGEKPEAINQALVGIGTATVELVSEQLGLGQLFKISRRLAGRIGDLVVRGRTGEALKVIGDAVEIGAVGFAEEAAAQVGGNLIAQTYDPARGTLEGVGEAGLAGVIGAGAVGVGAGVGSALRARATARQQLGIEDEETRTGNAGPAPEQTASPMEPAPAPPSIPPAVSIRQQAEAITAAAAARVAASEAPAPEAAAATEIRAPEPIAVGPDGTAFFGNALDAALYADEFNRTRDDEGIPEARVVPMMGGAAFAVVARPREEIIRENIARWQPPELPHERRLRLDDAADRAAAMLALQSQRAAAAANPRTPLLNLGRVLAAQTPQPPAAEVEPTPEPPAATKPAAEELTTPTKAPWQMSLAEFQGRIGKEISTPGHKEKRPRTWSPWLRQIGYRPQDKDMGASLWRELVAEAVRRGDPVPPEVRAEAEASASPPVRVKAASADAAPPPSTPAALTETAVWEGTTLVSGEVDFAAHKNPNLAVPCPTCGAKVDQMCRRPSGHQADQLHAARRALADKIFDQQGGGEITNITAGTPEFRTIGEGIWRYVRGKPKAPKQQPVRRKAAAKKSPASPAPKVGDTVVLQGGMMGTVVEVEQGADGLRLTLEHDGGERESYGPDRTAGLEIIDPETGRTIAPEKASILSVLSPEKQARAEELKKRLQAKLNTELRTGIDPEIVAIGAELGALYLEAGAKKFRDFALALVADVGEAITPYLQALYLAARRMPGVDRTGTDSADYVDGLSDEQIRAMIAQEPTDEAADKARGPERTAAGSEPVLPGQTESSGRDATGDAAGDDRGGDAAGPPAADSQPGGGGRGTAAGRGRAARRRGRAGAGGVRGRPAAGTRAGDAAAAGPGSDGSRTLREVIADRRRKLPDDRRNHRIGPDDVLIPGGPAARIRANLDAIRLSKKLEAEKRLPTPAEKKILAQYVGWGDSRLATLFDRLKFNRIKQAEEHGRELIYEDDRTWKAKHYKVAKELRELLTEEEFDAAARSTQNAHYTSREVIERGLWAIARRLGFKGGYVLENSAGIGHVIGLMPADLEEASHWTAVELDSVTSRMLAQLYPEADVFRMGFQDAPIDNNSHDLVIGNPPFAKDGPIDKRYPRFSLHNYMLARSIDVTKPGGIIVQITSSSTMDNAASRTFREWAAQRVDLVGAIRLPNDAFEHNAGTNVTTDILVFRKKDGRPFQGERWLDTREMAVEKPKRWNPADGEPPSTVWVNEYFHAHPEMMLGRMSLEGTMYGPGQPALVANPGQDTLALLDAAVARLPENIVAFDPVARAERERAIMAERGKPFSFQLHEGRVMQVSPEGTLQPPVWAEEDQSGAKAKIAAALIEMRDAARELIAAQLAEGTDERDLERRRRALNALYDRFVKRHGHINTPKVRSIFGEDPEFGVLAGLEFIDEEIVEKPGKGGKIVRTLRQTVSKADILTKRTQFPVTPPQRAESAADAVAISESWRSYLDLEYVARLLGLTQEEAADRLLAEGAAFLDPATGQLTSADQYLSGNVREKLRTAEEAAAKDQRYARNVDALRAAIPPDRPISQITVKLGATWIPPKVYEDWFKHLFGVSYAGEVYHVPETSSMVVKWSPEVLHSEKNRTTLAGGGQPATSLIEDALALGMPKVYRTERDEHGKEKRILDPERTEAAREQFDKLRDEFQRWAKASVHGPELVRIYNEHFNSEVPRKFRPPPFAYLPGQSTAYFAPRPAQLAAIMRGVRESYLLAHEVGVGKTMTFIGTAMEWRRLGLAKKPMIAVLNSTVPQIVETFKRMYPQANVLAPTERDFEAGNRQRFLARIATGDYDAIVIAHSQFDRLADDPARVRGWIRGEMDKLEAALQQIDPDGKVDSRGRRKSRDPRVKQLEAKLQKLEERLESLTDRATDDTIAFEQLGVDGLIVDEAHYYKKVYFDTRMEQVRGLDTDFSQRGVGLLMKVRWVQERTGGRNVILSTGTPVTNTLAEAWNVMRVVRPDLMKEWGIDTFDDFASGFAAVVSGLEMDATGRWKEVRRLARFDNVSALSQLFRRTADVVFADEVAEIRRPKIKGGKPRNIDIKAGPALKRIMANLIAQYEWFEGLKGKEKMENRHLPLVINGQAKKAALDVRLLEPDAPEDHPSKIAVLADEVYRLWKLTEPQRGTQVIFADLYRSSDGKFNLFDAIRDALVAKGIPADQIANVLDIEGEGKLARARRAALFEDVNAGNVRVIMGTTAKLGVGVNIQKRLYAAHHLDAPWRPSDMEQRNGRIIRQGNDWVDLGDGTVEILHYGTEQTFDAGAFQRLARKQRMIREFVAGRTAEGSVEDIDDEGTASYEEAAAAFSGDPLTQRRFELRKELQRLEALRAAHEDAIVAARHRQSVMREAVRDTERDLATLRAWMDQHRETLDDPDMPHLTLNDQTWTDRQQAAEALAPIFEQMEQRHEAFAADPATIAERQRGGMIGMSLGSAKLGTVPISLRSVAWYGANGQMIGPPEVRYSYTPPGGEEIMGSGRTPQGMLRSLLDSRAKVAAQEEELLARLERLNASVAELDNTINKPFEHGPAIERTRKELDEVIAQLEAKGDSEKVSKEDERDFAGMISDRTGGGMIDHVRPGDVPALLQAAGPRRAKFIKWMLRQERMLAPGVADALRAEQEKGRPTSAPEGDAPRRFDERLEQRLTRAIEGARARIRARRLPRGRDVGGGTIIEDSADLAIIIAASALREGIRGGRKLSNLVKKIASELGFRGSTEQARKFARAILADAGGDPERFDRALLAFRDARERRGTPAARRREIAAIRAAVKQVGPRPKDPAAEAMKREFRRIERVTARAYAAGRAEVLATIPAIKDAVRRAVRAEGAKRQARSDALRNQIIDVVETLPLRLRGRFLKAVRTATTPRDLKRVVNRVERTLAKDVAWSAVKRLRRLASPKRMKLTAERRERTLQLLKEVEALWKAGVATKADADAIVERLNEALELRADQWAENKTIKAHKLATREQLVAELVEKVERQEKIPGDEAIRENKSASIGRDYFRGFEDVRGWAHLVEGDSDGVIGGLFETLRVAEDAYHSRLREEQRAVEQALQAAGFKDLPDALAKLGGALGEASVERVEVTLGGQKVKLRLGEAVAIAAMDEPTRALIDPPARVLKSGPRKGEVVEREGAPLQVERGREVTPIEGVTIDELDAIADLVNTRYPELVRQLKLVIEGMQADLFRAHRRLKGYEPPRVPGYFPRARNVRYSEERGLPEGWRGIRDRYLENLGLLKPREEGGRTPVVIRDAVTVVLEHITNAAKVIHLAEAVRDADMVLSDPRVVAAVNSRHGSRANAALRTHLMAASLANATGGDAGARLARRLNSNLAVSYLALNDTSMLRQLGGLFRLIPLMGSRSFLDGLKGWKAVTMRDLTELSGYFWSRYVGNSFGRFSPVLLEASELVQAANMQRSLRALLAGIKVRHPRSMGLAWTAAKQQVMRAFNWMDAVSGRVAFAGYLAESRRLHPDWSEQRHREWAIEQASVAIRKTQNPNSTLDMTTAALRNRETAWSLAFLFTSDVLRARGRIKEAFRESNTEGAKAVFAEAANVLWSRSVGIGSAVALAAIAGLLGGEDDWEERIKEAARLDAQLAAAAEDVVSLVGGPHIGVAVRALLYPRADAVDIPAIEAVNDTVELARGLVDLPGAVWEGDYAKAGDRFLKALEGASLAAAVTFGNPLHAPLTKVLRQLRRELKDE